MADSSISADSFIWTLVDFVSVAVIGYLLWENFFAPTGSAQNSTTTGQTVATSTPGASIAPTQTIQQARNTAPLISGNAPTASGNPINLTSPLVDFYPGGVDGTDPALVPIPVALGDQPFGIVAGQGPGGGIRG